MVVHVFEEGIFQAGFPHGIHILAYLFELIHQVFIELFLGRGNADAFHHPFLHFSQECDVVVLVREFQQLQDIDADFFHIFLRRMVGLHVLEYQTDLSQEAFQIRTQKIAFDVGIHLHLDDLQHIACAVFFLLQKEQGISAHHQMLFHQVSEPFCQIPELFVWHRLPRAAQADAKAGLLLQPFPQPFQEGLGCLMRQPFCFYRHDLLVDGMVVRHKPLRFASQQLLHDLRPMDLADCV